MFLCTVQSANIIFWTSSVTRNLYYYLSLSPPPHWLQVCKTFNFKFYFENLFWRKTIIIFQHMLIFLTFFVSLYLRIFLSTHPSIHSMWDKGGRGKKTFVFGENFNYSLIRQTYCSDTNLWRGDLDKLKRGLAWWKPALNYSLLVLEKVKAMKISIYISHS